MADAETNRSTVTAAFEAWQKGEGYIGTRFAGSTEPFRPVKAHVADPHATGRHG